MSISIIGAGNVGMALGKAFSRKGEEVIFGVTDPAKYQPAIAELGNLAAVTSIAKAVSASDIVILAVPYAAVTTIARSIPDWAGKILIDATNPIAPGLAGLSVGTTTSGAEELAKIAFGARVVKAFNTTGAENLGDSTYTAGKIFMPVCGNNAQATQRVMALATLIGFDAVDLGPLIAARYLEGFAMTWIHLALKQGFGRNFAFGMLRRD